MTQVWIVVADGEHARVVVPAARHGQFATAVAFDSADAHLLSRDLGDERPGRQPRQDPHKAAKLDFIRFISQELDRHCSAGAFGQLVIVAPAHALHDLRAALSGPASAMIVGTLAKDLTKTPDHDLMPHLAEWWRKPKGAAA
jgi:protein required for attachment to host cells